ncbi:hypothetical protein [Halalkalicoccus jeotgali]|uniref:Uncharacterized protein n=1 Tax=Halalkalicoccus jeotgali (strain DSM 18796 / CECT 7217 / JCM 14584 / KCTC 4019 / B3) TaxID=795797 RepID=D8JCR2_HALJB|nr:hypothetical protein [Halalkalicoccus jeotgali]ADJ16807.1 hypothetical protein HacjB3_17323 [Halalkalicoccus jeotgali B3]ADJ17201.1 hypothetical protein HacjB3_19323 [Halalkalicoccus jeotgali B3]ELY41665.1 hypothetical protein C497_00210 [Halalkalicoccus jeotgali B3]
MSTHDTTPTTTELSNASDNDTDGNEAAETVTKRRVGKLLGEQRRRLSDDVIRDYDKINSDGHKVKTVKKRDADGKKYEAEINLSQLYNPTPSTTSDIDILVIEARINDEADEGEVPIENPHIPVHDGVLERAEKRLDDEGLTPAWGVVTE